MPTAAEAKKQKTASLKARMNCSASSCGEKETARKLLENQKERLTAQGVPAKICSWSTEATLRQGNRLVHYKALMYFLNHVRDGQWVDNRTIPFSSQFGSGDFYAILFWLQEIGLVSKMGSRYQIKSTLSIKRAWNKFAKTLIFGE